MMGEYQNTFYEQCRSGMFGFGWMGTVTIILVVFILIILFMMKKPNNSTGDDSLNALKRKFVNGELTEEEYLYKKDILNRK